MLSPTTTCEGPECGRAAARGALCWGHLRQHRLGQPLRPLAPARGGKQRLRLHATAFARLRKAALAYSDSESEQDFRNAEVNLGRAALDYAMARLNRLRNRARARPLRRRQH